MALSLTLVDELITARRTLHGGSRGAPVLLQDGTREGSALNRACVVMLTSAMQAYVEDVFLACSQKAFGHTLNDVELKDYEATWSRWGNPSDANIIRLFRRLGIHDVFDGLSWQGQTTATLKTTLNKINQVRNRIAHGEALQINGVTYSLSLNQVQRWRRTCSIFGDRFEQHALNKIRG